MSPRTTLAIFLVGVLWFPEAGWPQQPAAPKPDTAPAKPAAAAPGRTLKVTAVQGEGAINNIRTRSGTAPAVDVRDDSNNPVAGAQVIFELPYAGASGTFTGMMRYQTVKTDEQGRAAATGFTPNDQEGRFNIKVTVTQGNQAGGLTISQTNSRGATAAAKSSRKTWWIVVAVAAVAGIAGGVAATRGGSGTATIETTPVSITAGPVTVGGPR